MLYCASFEKGCFQRVYDLKTHLENCAQYNIILLLSGWDGPRVLGPKIN